MMQPLIPSTEPNAMQWLASRRSLEGIHKRAINLAFVAALTFFRCHAGRSGLGT